MTAPSFVLIAQGIDAFGGDTVARGLAGGVAGRRGAPVVW